MSWGRQGGRVALLEWEIWEGPTPALWRRWMPRGWDEVPWLMSPLMPTGNPNHIIEDMWLGVTVASQGPAGRVLVSQGSPSDPPPDISFHLPGATEGSREQKGPWCRSLQMSISAAVCLHGHVCPFILHLWQGDGEGVWHSPKGQPGSFLNHPFPPPQGRGGAHPLWESVEGTTRWKGQREPQAVWPGRTPSGEAS